MSTFIYNHDYFAILPYNIKFVMCTQLILFITRRTHSSDIFRLSGNTTEKNKQTEDINCKQQVIELAEILTWPGAY